MAKGKMKKGLKITLIILGILLALIIAALLIAPKMIVKTIYKQNFGTRFTSSEPHCRDIAEFDGLEREKHVFTSNEGQKITGYVLVSDVLFDSMYLIIHQHAENNLITSPFARNGEAYETIFVTCCHTTAFLADKSSHFGTVL
mgnify:CR=1 FL=1